MSWHIMCPGCGTMFEIDDNAKSVPNAEHNFINGTICENCGRDMVDSLKRAAEEIIPMIYEQKRKNIK